MGVLLVFFKAMENIFSCRSECQSDAEPDPARVQEAGEPQIGHIDVGLVVEHLIDKTLVRLTPMSYSTRVAAMDDRVITRYLTRALIGHCTT